jgi:hypothetical protein
MFFTASIVVAGRVFFLGIGGMHVFSGLVSSLVSVVVRWICA